MTQKDKELLLNDLCTRLPYGLKVQYTTGNGIHIDCGVDMISITSECVGIFKLGTSKIVWRGIEDIKPYLRPMSNATNKEKEEYNACASYGNYEDIMIDRLWFLNKKHFDYCGLISLGLALEAPEGMYKTE